MVCLHKLITSINHIIQKLRLQNIIKCVLWQGSYHNWESVIINYLLPAPGKQFRFLISLISISIQVWFIYSVMHMLIPNNTSMHLLINIEIYMLWTEYHIWQNREFQCFNKPALIKILMAFFFNNKILTELGECTHNLTSYIMHGLWKKRSLLFDIH